MKSGTHGKSNSQFVPPFSMKVSGMIFRQLPDQLLEAALQFPVVAVLGPRQSDKTTLVQKIFSNHRYISFEELDNRSIANTDPRRFLQDFPDKTGIILDEIPHIPLVCCHTFKL